MNSVYKHDPERRIHIECVVSGNNKQLTITIPKRAWRMFPINKLVKIVLKKETLDSLYIPKNISLISCGHQRIVTIPQTFKNRFQKGDLVRLYPEKIVEVTLG